MFFVNILAQLGGIVNVFFGCSILTLLEIMQIIWYVIKNRYYSRQEKVQQVLPGKPKTKSPRNKNKKQKTVKFAKHGEEFAGNQKRTRIDMNNFNTFSNFKVWPILVVVPSHGKRNNH